MIIFLVKHVLNLLKNNNKIKGKMKMTNQILK